MDNSLVLEHIFGYVTPLRLKQCRLVNRIWHHEATLALQKCGGPIKLRTPTNLATAQLLKLAETNNQFMLHWPYPQVRLIVTESSVQTIEKTLCTLSPHLTQLNLQFSNGLESFKQQDVSINFSRLTHFTCEATNAGASHQLQAWVISNSPMLRYLNVHLEPSAPTEQNAWWPLLSQLADMENLKLKSLQVTAYAGHYLTSDNLPSVIKFLGSQQKHLKKLVLACRLASDTTPTPAGLHFSRLIELEVGIKEAAFLFDSAQSSLRSSSLRSLGPNPGEWWLQVDKMAQVFPNVKVLRLSRIISEERVALARLLSRLNRLEELSLKFRDIKKFFEMQFHLHSAFQKIQVLRLEYLNGQITEQDFQNVFMGMENLKRLHLLAPAVYTSWNGKVNGISKELMNEMKNKFDIIWEKR